MILIRENAFAYGPTKRLVIFRDYFTGLFDFNFKFFFSCSAQPVVVDRDFAAALKRYAQLLARVILGKKTAGLNLSDDIKVI